MTPTDPRRARPDAPLAHHELCFGCGAANLFGLQMELERTADGVTGRFFLKQDHQGAAGSAHVGVIAAALDEAMALAAQSGGDPAITRHLDVDARAPAPVGAYLQVEAAVERREGGRLEARATAWTAGEERVVAEAQATLVRASDGAGDDGVSPGSREASEPAAPGPISERAISLAREAREGTKR